MKAFLSAQVGMEVEFSNEEELKQKMETFLDDPIGRFVTETPLIAIRGQKVRLHKAQKFLGGC